MKITVDTLHESIELKECTNEELALLQYVFGELSQCIGKIFDERTGWDKMLEKSLQYGDDAH